MFHDETTVVDVKLVANNEFVQFQTWDFPGEIDLSGKYIDLMNK